jgi:hypothetical protein
MVSSSEAFGKKEIVKTLRRANHVPIEFYGRLVDQHSNAVPNVSIEGRIQYNDGLHEGIKKLLTKSDENGLFQVSGQFGKSIGFSFLDANYLVLSTNTYFVYSHLWPVEQRHIPDPEHPIIFQLWKKSTNYNPLAIVKISLKGNFWTAPLRIDLLTGKFVQEGGDIALLFRGEQPRPQERAARYWAVQMISENGGIIPVPDIIPIYQAPREGWVTQIECQPEKVDEGFDNYIGQGVLIKSRNEKCFFKVGFSFSVMPSDAGASVEIRGIANTNASPVWENQPREGWY